MDAKNAKRHWTASRILKDTEKLMSVKDNSGAMNTNGHSTPQTVSKDTKRFM